MDRGIPESFLQFPKPLKLLEAGGGKREISLAYHDHGKVSSATEIYLKRLVGFACQKRDIK